MDNNRVKIISLDECKATVTPHNKYEIACKEFLKGCSCSSVGNPGECPECVKAFFDHIRGLAVDEGYKELDFHVIKPASHPVDVLKECIHAIGGQVDTSVEKQLRQICDQEVCGSCGLPILNWTKDMPTVPGWYWVKNSHFGKGIVNVFFKKKEIWLHSDESDYPLRLSVYSDNTEWAGPLEPPKG